MAAAPVPVLLDLAHPLDAVRAPGGVDLTLHLCTGESVTVRLHGGLVQRLIASVRTAHAVPACSPDPSALGALETMTPRERLDAAFAAVLASARTTSARSSGTAKSAATDSGVSGVPAFHD